VLYESGCAGRAGRRSLNEDECFAAGGGDSNTRTARDGQCGELGLVDGLSIEWREHLITSPAALGHTAQGNTPSIPFVGYAVPVLIGWFRCNDTLSSQSNDVRLVETSGA